MNEPKQRLGLQWEPLPYAFFQAERDDPMPGSWTGLPAPAAGQEPANPTTSPATSAAPDSVLYNRAEDDIKHGRYDIARLSLQTLINTYPDSEYLAKAKLAIADSYYKEGGTSGLTQAIAEYKDFITFFPFLDEAAYAQMQVGMAYYRMMVKPDRDSSEAVNAEAEFQTFVQKYPNSKLEPAAEQRLREVQEVLAEGNFRVASFYYTRTAYRAAGARLIELTNRYPLYSQADQASSAATAAGSSQPRRPPAAYSRQNSTIPAPDSAASAGASDAT